MKLQFERQNDGHYKAVVYAGRRDSASPDRVEVGYIEPSVDPEDEPWTIYLDGEGTFTTTETFEEAKTFVEASVMWVISGKFGGS